MGCVRQSNAEAGKKISCILVEKDWPTINLIKDTVELTKSGVSEINKHLIESNFKWVPCK
jgi:hypothetical protein